MSSRDYLLPALRMGHGEDCCSRSLPHTDAAKRISDAVNLHWAAQGFDCARRWLAVRLEDGTGGNTLYDNKRDAVRHQLDETLCAYICLTGAPMSPCEAEIILKTHRQAYDNGFRLTDPDDMSGGRDIIPRVTTKDRIATIQHLQRGT
jgi:hypothetical protein